MTNNNKLTFTIKLIACIPFLFPSSSFAKDSITWANLHFPPWMILEGENKGLGVWDEMLSHVITELPEYNHIPIIMNNLRYEKMAKQGRNVCKIYYFKTQEREEILYYSNPSVVFLSNFIIMRKEKALQLGNPTSYSLEQLMKNDQFRGLIIKGRSYGKVIDQLIDRYNSEEYVDSKVIDNRKMFNVINKGRTDYILEFPAIRSFIESEMKVKPDVVNISIEEAKPYNITYVTCVKNEWGKQIIERINTIMEEYILTESHREATLRWYDEMERQQLSDIYDEVLIYNAIQE